MNKSSMPLLGLVVITLLSILIAWSSVEHKQEVERLNALEIERQAAMAAEKAKKALTINTEHVKCIALNIYHEAGSEPFMGQVAVARVVMNRVKHGFGSNPCRVVYQQTLIPDNENPDESRRLCQFSWVCEGKGEPSKNNPRYRQAEQIARDVLLENKWHDVIPSNILFFHNNTVNPGWAYYKAMDIGNHVFYSKGKPKFIKTIHTEEQ